MATWGGGGSLIAFPTNTASTAMQMEYQKINLQASNDNPFTGQQQIQDWQSSYATISVMLPPMSPTNGQNWIYFFDQLVGIVNVFQFPASFVTDARFSYWITSDGTNSKVFRMKSPMTPKAVIKEGPIYTFPSFEIREAI